MGFYDGFDLETAVVSPEDPFFDLPPAVDFVFAINAPQANPIVMLQKNGAEIAFLDGRPYEDVPCLVDGTLTFTGSILDVPFDPDDTVIVKTPLGNQFKVGKPAYDVSGTITFSYSRLQ